MEEEMKKQEEEKDPDDVLSMLDDICN